MAGRLDGKIAIITGGSRGIGASIAESFAREGAKVVIASRKIEGLVATADAINAKYPDSVTPRACHIGKSEAIVELVEFTRDEVGLPNVLVNNGATNPYFGPLLNISEAAWDKTFEVNLKGYFEMMRQVAKGLMKEKQPGSFVNVASVVGLRAAPFQGVYAMTKASIISMTKTLAMELGGANIRVNAIAPGLVETRLAAAITSSKDLTAYFTDRTAVKRVAQPDEMTGIAVYLASDEASYVTGQTIAVDGGFTIS